MNGHHGTTPVIVLAQRALRPATATASGVLELPTLQAGLSFNDTAPTTPHPRRISYANIQGLQAACRMRSMSRAVSSTVFGNGLAGRLLAAIRQAAHRDRGIGRVMIGGGGGIRTLDTGVPYTHFPGVRLRPLGHPSRTCLLSTQWPSRPNALRAFRRARAEKAGDSSRRAAGCKPLRVADSSQPSDSQLLCTGCSCANGARCRCCVRELNEAAH
jgi:hypothetical protein